MMLKLTSTHVPTLLWLLDLLAELSPADTVLRAVEVGVYRGETSAQLLQQQPTLQLTMVDRWNPVAEDSDYRKSGDELASLSEKECAHCQSLARERVAFAADRARIVVSDSLTAAAALATQSFHLVFIDAEHTETAVQADIAAWWPLVMPGGILSGHDYGIRKFPGVEAAVQNWNKSNPQLVVHTSPGHVWWVRKPRFM